MLTTLRSIWQRLPIPYAVRNRISPHFAWLIAYMVRRRMVRPLRPDEIAPGAVIVSGFLSDVTGIGRAGRLTLDAIRDRGVPTIAHDLRTDLEARTVREQAPPGGIWLCHCNPPQVLELLTRDTYPLWAERYRIGYWAYELPELPAAWRRTIPYFHEIWAPSEFVAKAITQARGRLGPIVRVVPHPLPDLASASRNRALIGRDNDFVFLVMFDARSSFARKNPMGAIRAFQAAFTPATPGVALHLKVVASHVDPASLAQLRSLADGWENIRIATEHLSDAEALQLIASADCLVSLHRAEGFGLTLAEAMAVGTPVIATAWSGNVQFTAGGIMDVPYRLIEAHDESGRYEQAGQFWADADIEAAAAHMRRVVADPPFRAALVERARRLVHQRLDRPIDITLYSRFIAPATPGA